MAGLRRHRLELADVISVTYDDGLWAICTAGVFRGHMRGMIRRQIEIGEMIPYTSVGDVIQRPAPPPGT